MAASVDAVTFLKASTGCSLFLCEGQLRGKLQTRGSVVGGMDVVPLLRASILEVNPVRGTKGCVGRLGGGKRYCGVEAAVATMMGRVKSEALRWLR